MSHSQESSTDLFKVFNEIHIKKVIHFKIPQCYFKFTSMKSSKYQLIYKFIKRLYLFYFVEMWWVATQFILDKFKFTICNTLDERWNKSYSYIYYATESEFFSFYSNTHLAFDGNYYFDVSMFENPPSLVILIAFVYVCILVYVAMYTSFSFELVLQLWIQYWQSHTYDEAGFLNVLFTILWIQTKNAFPRIEKNCRKMYEILEFIKENLCGLESMKLFQNTFYVKKITMHFFHKSILN